MLKAFSKGFNERDLRYVRAFFLLFPIRNALCTGLSSTLYCTLLRVGNETARQSPANTA